jgi:hypothetical protein
MHKKPKAKIKVNIFDDLREALRDATAYERGEPVNLRITRIPNRPKEAGMKASATWGKRKTLA